MCGRATYSHAHCSDCPAGRKSTTKLYGGTERVVAWLIEEFVELGMM